MEDSLFDDFIHALDQPATLPRAKRERLIDGDPALGIEGKYVRPFGFVQRIVFAFRIGDLFLLFFFLSTGTARARRKRSCVPIISHPRILSFDAAPQLY